MITTAQKTTSTLKAQISHWYMAGFITFTFFSYGTAMMDYFLFYPSRLIVGEKEFVTYHALLEERIIPISVVPFTVLTLLNITLLFFKLPHTINRLLWVSFICLLLDWLSSIFIQIPMNIQLGEARDPELIQSVMDKN